MITSANFNAQPYPPASVYNHPVASQLGTVIPLPYQIVPVYAYQNGLNPIIVGHTLAPIPTQPPQPVVDVNNVAQKYLNPLPPPPPPPRPKWEHISSLTAPQLSGDALKKPEAKPLYSQMKFDFFEESPPPSPSSVAREKAKVTVSIIPLGTAAKPLIPPVVEEARKIVATHPPRVRVVSKSAEKCRKYIAGLCKLGNHCRYKHDVECPPAS